MLELVLRACPACQTADFLVRYHGREGTVDRWTVCCVDEDCTWYEGVVVDRRTIGWTPRFVEPAGVRPSARLHREPTRITPLRRARHRPHPSG